MESTQRAERLGLCLPRSAGPWRRRNEIPAQMVISYRFQAGAGTILEPKSAAEAPVPILSAVCAMWGTGCGHEGCGYIPRCPT